MTKQTVPDMKELFKQAAEIAKEVPELMQVAAFNRAIDLLTGATSSATPSASQTPTASPRKASSSGPKGEKPSGTVQQLMEYVDSTQHPGVRGTSKALDRALMILQIARTEHGVDGLTPGDIAKILTDKFRLSTGDSAVRMALGNATNLVNRVKNGNAFVYRIMGPGEEYLAHLSTGNEKSESSQQSRRKQGKPRSKKISPSTAAEDNGKSVQVRKPKKGTAPLGPKTAILSLVDAGFFTEPKTGPQVQEYLKKKRGFDLGIHQLRLAMLRLVRDGALERDENSEGQYEYKQP